MHRHMARDIMPPMAWAVLNHALPLGTGCVSSILGYICPCCCNLPGAGTYRLELKSSDPGVTPANLQLRIIPCPEGWVTATTGDTCIRCEGGQFSFIPSEKECNKCVDNAQCPGGAVVNALPGFWKCAQRSQQIHMWGQELFFWGGGYQGGGADPHRLAPHSAIRRIRLPGARGKASPARYA